MKNTTNCVVAVLLAAWLTMGAAHADDIDVAKLKTFGTIGKQVSPLSAEKEAELLRHEGKGCLTHKEENEFSAYRFHEDDPVFYQKGLRLTCRCGETLDGKMLHDPPETTYTTYVWLYQW